jgi:hypothetical protein
MAEQPAEMGTDYGWKFTLRKDIDETPLASNLLEAARPMESVGLDMAMFAAVIDDARPSMVAKLTLHGLDLDTFLISFAMSIYAYTLENPSLYRIVNGQMFDLKRSEGPGGVSAGLRACLPYIKYLEESLKALPEEFRFVGRCYRGVKWTFPSPQNHDPESYFHEGHQLFWYEFKSTSRVVSTMYQECFCGKTGPRTIFTIDAKCGYKIELFSDFGGAEAEVLFPPLTKLQVTNSMKHCDPLCLVNKDAGLPDQICLKQVVPTATSPASPPPPPPTNGEVAGANAPNNPGLIAEVGSMGSETFLIASGLKKGKADKQQLAEWCIANTSKPKTKTQLKAAVVPTIKKMLIFALLHAVRAASQDSTAMPPTPVPPPPLLDGFWAFLSYVQLPFIGAILILSTLTVGILRALPQAWSRHRLVEVALQVVAPILLTLGAWVPLAFKPPHADPFGIALVASLLLRIIMFTNKVHSMQTGGTDCWR